MNFPNILTADTDTRAGRMLAAGQVTATVKSLKTGDHITLKFRCIADNRDRQYDDASRKNWIACPLADATHVFVEVPGASGDWADKVGTFYPRTGKWYSDDRADAARVYAAAMVGHWINGVQFDNAEVLEEERCGHCGRKLTDPVSITRGIGPECYRKDTGSHHQVKDLTTQAGRQAALDAGYQPTLEDFAIDQGTTVAEIEKDTALQMSLDSEDKFDSCVQVLEALPVAGITRGQAFVILSETLRYDRDLIPFGDALSDRLDAIYAAHTDAIANDQDALAR